MRKQKIHCVVIDGDVKVTASLDAALRDSDVLLELEAITSVQQIVPVLSGKKPHLLFCPQGKNDKGNVALLETVRRHSPDTLLVWISRDEWQGLTTWLMGVESCTLPLNDAEYFTQYVDFLLRYSAIKHEFRECKHLLGVSELRCHWLVDYSWEAIAYVVNGMHLYANNAYITLFGFESIAEVRSMLVSHLVDVTERKLFETMAKAADVGSKPSSRLLISLRTLEGEQMRAEVRFIPAVFKGKRCTQLHVRPLDRQVRVSAALKANDNPWEKTQKRLQEAPMPGTAAEVAAQVAPLQTDRESASVEGNSSAGLQMAFTRSLRLRQHLPELVVAEPGFRQDSGQILAYEELVRKLDDGDGRFRLDYWSLGQTVKKLVAQAGKAPGYLIFVSVGGAIFNNEKRLKRILELLRASPEATQRIVVGIQYQDCIAHVRKLGEVVKQLRATGVHLAVDNLAENAQSLKLVQTLKPAFTRLSPIMSARVVRSTEAARQLHKMVHHLGENSRVIVSGVDEVAALNLVYATSAAYVQGTITRQK